MVGGTVRPICGPVIGPLRQMVQCSSPRSPVNTAHLEICFLGGYILPVGSLSLGRVLGTTDLG